MPAKKTALRVGAIALMFGGIGVYAAQSGLLPGIGNAQSAAVAPTSVALVLDTPPQALTTPAVAQTAKVRLPSLTSDLSVGGTAIRLVQFPDDPTTPDTSDTASTTPAEVSEFGLPCTVTVTADAMPAAMVALDVLAPCLPNARIAVDHAGLRVTGQTDALGLMTMDIPAFETPAFFEVTLPDGEVQTTLVGLPDLPDYNRVAVQWTGAAQLELHALEFGAAFGGPGHIWQDAPGEMADAMVGTGGFLTQIGSTDLDDPMVAQIYTFPRQSLGDGDNVRFSIDAPITETSCEQTLTARSLEIAADGAVQITPIEMTLPSCDAVGDYLVLQNVLQDLRLASN